MMSLKKKCVVVMGALSLVSGASFAYTQSEVLADLESQLAKIANEDPNLSVEYGELNYDEMTNIVVVDDLSFKSTEAGAEGEMTIDSVSYTFVPTNDTEIIDIPSSSYFGIFGAKVDLNQVPKSQQDRDFHLFKHVFTQDGLMDFDAEVTSEVSPDPAHVIGVDSSFLMRNVGGINLDFGIEGIYNTLQGKDITTPNLAFAAVQQASVKDLNMEVMTFDLSGLFDRFAKYQGVEPEELIAELDKAISKLKAEASDDVFDVIGLEAMTVLRQALVTDEEFGFKVSVGEKLNFGSFLMLQGVNDQNKVVDMLDISWEFYTK